MRALDSRAIPRGYTPDAKTTARGSHVHVELIDLDRFITLWREFYPKLTDEDKALLPRFNQMHGTGTIKTGVGAAETGESIARGWTKEARGWGSQRGRNVSRMLGALSRFVKR